MKQTAKLIVMLMMMFFMAVCAYAGDLEPPSGTPGSTMKTLDEIPPSWHQILSASERFKDVMGGEAVLDKETGLVWAKNANLDGAKSWAAATNYCITLTIANRKGWRLPTVQELASLLDMSISGNPKVPAGVFSNVQSGYYWSGTAYAHSTGFAWYVSLSYGTVYYYNQPTTYYVLPVRGGND